MRVSVSVPYRLEKKIKEAQKSGQVSFSELFQKAFRDWLANGDSSLISERRAKERRLKLQQVRRLAEEIIDLVNSKS